MNISAYRADYLPLLGQLMNQMKLPQIINEAVTKPNSQAIVDAGTMISGMILNQSVMKITLRPMNLGCLMGTENMSSFLAIAIDICNFSFRITYITCLLYDKSLS